MRGTLSNHLLMGFVSLFSVVACAATEDGDGDSDDGGTGGTGGAGGSGGTCVEACAGGAGGSGGAHVVACPELTGTFDCPATETQAAYVLTISQVDNADGTTSYLFDLRGQTSDIIATIAGYNQEGWIGQCVEYQGLDALAYYYTGQMSQASYHVINAAGDYQVDNGGQTTIVCPRSS